MWCVRLSDSQRDALRALVKEEDGLSTSLKGAVEALDYARWDELPEAQLPWERVSELASAQTIGEADVVWDRAAGMPPKRARARRRAPRKAARS